jgi:hypothetical protein
MKSIETESKKIEEVLDFIHKMNAVMCRLRVIFVGKYIYVISFPFRLLLLRKENEVLDHRKL